MNTYPWVTQSKITFSQDVKHQGGDNLTTQHLNTSLEEFINGYEWQSSRFVSNFALQEEISSFRKWFLYLIVSRMLTRKFVSQSI